jgi:hypothetical protein
MLIRVCRQSAAEAGLGLGAGPLCHAIEPRLHVAVFRVQGLPDAGKKRHHGLEENIRHGQASAADELASVAHLLV